MNGGRERGSHAVGAEADRGAGLEIRSVSLSLILSLRLMLRLGDVSGAVMLVVEDVLAIGGGLIRKALSHGDVARAMEDRMTARRGQESSETGQAV